MATLQDQIGSCTRLKRGIIRWHSEFGGRFVTYIKSHPVLRSLTLLFPVLTATPPLPFSQVSKKSE